MPQLLAHRSWVRRQQPFPHVVAEDVFTPTFYRALAEHYRRISTYEFRATMAGYDATAARIRDHLDGPLAVFATREWHDLIAGVAGVQATGDVTAALHHHEPGGEPGWPHNDLNPGWFGGPEPESDEIRLEGVDGVDYYRGDRPTGVTARETVRAVSVMFYLANPPWSPGDGGETGLYPSFDEGVQGTGRLVPPVNNSLVMFECTPFTWHSYAGRSRNPRNCVVMWLHRPKHDAIERWGEASIANW
ncbi:2OG-Fe(II) oxygenase [Skermania piniformis]|uniref:2OG-Fe(II) oxygenase n=2 Tax=Skermania pinensis TaxID=39122 RepID=A0ABX8SCK9_9ACTN|nr:2OG-Fe(II) oxygenase [Skermania piniformis]